MTIKEKILRMIERLPDDVTYDRVMYHLDVMKAIEEGEAQIARGEVIDHDELFAELLGEDAKSPNHMGRESKARSAKHSKVHRSRRPPNRGGIHKKTQESRREAQGLP